MDNHHLTNFKSNFVTILGSVVQVCVVNAFASNAVLYSIQMRLTDNEPLQFSIVAHP